MSGTTSTPNYGLLKPNVGADNDLWGDHINSDLDILDTQLKAVSNKAGVVSFNGRNNVVSLTNADVVTVLPGSVTAPLMDGTATAGLATTWAKGDHVHPTDTTRAAAGSVPSPSAIAPTMNSVADAGTATAYSRGDHVHPVDTSRYAASNPSGYQTAAQVTTALLPYAPLASPALTGSPTVPTVTPSTDSSTKIASTAFVQSALGAVPGGAVIAATAPAGLNPGALWWDSTGGQLYVRYDDGNTQQWVAADNLTGLANAATQNDVAMSQNNVGRNKLHNGLFTVAQRGAGPWTGIGGAYTVDRWQVQSGLDATTINQTIIVDGTRAAIGDEAAEYALDINCTGNAGASSYTIAYQPIERVRRLAGKTVVISFWAAASSGTPKLGISIDQNFGTGGSPSAPVQNNGVTVTLSTTWTRYSTTVVVPSVSGKTLGTANNDATFFNLWVSAGSAFVARSGGVGVQTARVFLWGVQLEIAAPGQTQPSPLEKLDPRMELANCQRFYQVGYAGMTTYTTAGNGIQSITQLAVPMRAIATFTNSGITQVNTTNAGVGAWGDKMSYAASATATATGPVSFNMTFTASADL